MSRNMKRYVEDYHKLSSETTKLEYDIQDLKLNIARLQKDTKWKKRDVSDYQLRRKIAASLMKVIVAFMVVIVCINLSDVPQLLSLFRPIGIFFTADMIWLIKSHLGESKAQEAVAENERILVTLEEQKQVCENLANQYQKDLQYILEQLQDEHPIAREDQVIENKKVEVQSKDQMRRQDTMEELSDLKEDLLQAFGNEEKGVSKVVRK